MLIFQEKKSSKKLLFLSGILLILFLFIFFPKEAKAAQYTAGWYNDIGLVEDNSCAVDQWRAYIGAKDSSGNALQADSLTITATWYETPEAAGEPVYSLTSNNATSVLTVCISNRSSGIMLLTVDVSKAGYYPMRGANTSQLADGLSEVRWLRTLYLAEDTMDPNVAYEFPINNQWLDSNNLQMEIFARKRPAANSITMIETRAFNYDTGQEIFATVNPGIASGTVVLPAQNYPDGSYLWRVSLMKDDQNFFYNESGFDMFRVDTVAPVFEEGSPYMSVQWVEQDGEMVTYIIAYARSSDLDNNPEHDIQVSGVKRIEVYIEGILKGSCDLEPHPEGWCSRSFQDEYPEGTYSYYVIVYDTAGNSITSETKTFTIPPIDPSRLYVYSYIGSTSTPGAFMELISGEAGAGNNTTNYNYESTNIYTLSLRAPDFLLGRPFSFWDGGGCYSPDFQRTSSPKNILPDHYYACQAYFGTSVRKIVRSVVNRGTISPDLGYQICYDSPTDIEQTGGSPGGLGHSGLTGCNNVYSVYVGGTIADMVLYAHDSADGILKFEKWEGCDAYPSSRECQQSLNYGRGGYLWPVYSVERTVNVESYADGVLKPGASITNVSGLIPGGATDYAFKSTSTQAGLNTVLRAPLVFNVDGEDRPFDHWEGCDDFGGALGEECIVTEGGWYDTISRTLIAHYGTPSTPPGDDPVKRGEIRIQPEGIPSPIIIPLHKADDPNLYFIKEGIVPAGPCATGGAPLRVSDKNGNTRAIDLLPVDHLDASPIRIQTPYIATSSPDGIWALRKWEE